MIAKLSDFPNSGEFFHPFHAVIHTATLAAVVIISTVTRRKRLRIFCIFLFVPLILLWLYFGFAHLAGCATEW
jgi:hypothetical protein